MKKQTYLEINKVLCEIADLSYNEYDSHSFICGTFTAILCQAMTEMPAHKQAEILKSLQDRIEQYKARVAA